MIEVYGTKGVKSTSFHRKFKTLEAAYNWAEKNDATIDAHREVESCVCHICQKPAPKRPKLKAKGLDGNIYAVIGAARRALKDAGQTEQANAMGPRVMEAKSYSEALAIVAEYVEFKF